MQVSPDGRFEWNGTEWVPISARNNEFDAMVSPDGNYRWNGHEWVPIRPIVAFPPATPGAPVRSTSSSSTLLWKVIAGLGAALGAVGLIVAFGLSNPETPTAATSTSSSSPAVVTPSATSTPTPTMEASEERTMPTEGEATPAGDATSTSSSAAQFALEGRANATELLKDAADAQTALKQGGTFRLITNGAEMSFNLGQLQALTPPKRAAGEWNDAMSTLEDAVTHYTKAIEGDSVSKIAKAIDEIKVAARTARRIAEQTAP